MAENTLFWHDYETFGVDPQRDRPAQFAGVRTDLDLKIIDASVCFFCKTPEDYLPHPDACLITGITPQQVAINGLCEAQFAERIHAQISQPNTCTVGYNSLRFDDEVTRNIFYRNFYDPYAREWQNGNSRWDLIDVVRAAKALRPDGINWPVNDEGRPVFKLEALTQANSIHHESAHDALSDVYATIAMAKLIKSAQPKLYAFLWQHRTKTEALRLLQLGSFTPIVHVSGMYSALKHCLAVVLPLCKHPTNANEIVVYDLSVDPAPLLSLSSDEIQHRLFTASADLPEGIDRIPLKTVHINKCPVLAPLAVIRPNDAIRLEVDLSVCQLNSEKIQAAPALTEKLHRVYLSRTYPSQQDDPDCAIYSGGFFSEADKRLISKIRVTPPNQLMQTAFNFKDTRLPHMLFRYRARNYPETLSTEETKQWQAFCLNRLTGVNPTTSNQNDCGIVLQEYQASLQALRTRDDVDQELIDDLEIFAAEKMQRLSIPI